MKADPAAPFGVNWLGLNPEPAPTSSLADGSRTLGYLHWSYADNFEWIFGYSIKFGLVGVDRATLARLPKQSYYLYQSILKQQPK